MKSGVRVLKYHAFHRFRARYNAFQLKPPPLRQCDRSSCFSAETWHVATASTVSNFTVIQFPDFLPDNASFTINLHVEYRHHKE